MKYALAAHTGKIGMEQLSINTKRYDAHSSKTSTKAVLQF